MDFGAAYKGVIPAKAGIHELKLQENTASVRLHLICRCSWIPASAGMTPKLNLDPKPARLASPQSGRRRQSNLPAVRRISAALDGRRSAR